MNKKNMVIENAQIQFRNFSGKEGNFNPEGNRNFCVFLDSNIANDMKEDGWNVKWLNPRDEGDDPQAYLQVTVKFTNIPPKIVLVTSRGKSIINEDEVKLLDTAEIERADMTITPYKWEVNGKSGVKAYLKTLYVTIAEDEFESRYSNVPDSMVGSIGGCGNCAECDGKCKE